MQHVTSTATHAKPHWQHGCRSALVIVLMAIVVLAVQSRASQPHRRPSAIKYLSSASDRDGCQSDAVLSLVPPAIAFQQVKLSQSDHGYESVIQQNRAISPLVFTLRAEKFRAPPLPVS